MSSEDIRGDLFLSFTPLKTIMLSIDLDCSFRRTLFFFIVVRTRASYSPRVEDKDYLTGTCRLPKTSSVGTTTKRNRQMATLTITC
mmetsp:Transcript_27328/g.41989  ORF Transcript_27328/g.41989 Transcript_27328/m.41989 type:complete len:86 (-) Transcript_27328:472-729(-)